MTRKLKPVIDGEWKLIGPPPVGLDEKLPVISPRAASWQGADQAEAQEEHNAPVDHHIFQGPDNAWHLWGCVRHTNVGRILYHWETDDISSAPWRDTGELLRCDHEAGESIADWSEEEWMQSPYFVLHGGTYYMLYGGHGSGPDADDGVTYDDPAMPGQMCLMTSPDGRSWTRHDDGNGNSRIFAGPGEVRDPCVIRIGDLWHCYYAGFSDGVMERPGFFCRTSKDLINWSDYSIVYEDLKLGSGTWGTECPHVAYREGYYYMFRTENYYEAKTHVIRSEDPMNFNDGEYVGLFPAAAVEIYEVGGEEYVSSNHDPAGGTQLCRMKWEEDS